MNRTRGSLVFALALLPCAWAAEPEFASYESVKAVLDSFTGRLPAELAGTDAVAWSAWNGVRTVDMAGAKSTRLQRC